MEYYSAIRILVILFLFVQNEKALSFKNVNHNEFYPKLGKSCPKEDSMVIKGYNVKLSDFVRANGDVYNLCSYKMDLNVVKVFALNTLVIDRDVDVTGSHFKLFFVAPKWVIIGDRRIAVDGAIGKYMPRANSGSSTDRTGADGEPGNPGGPGGNFFGIGETFVDGHRLVITANGGIGGTGQFGGHGYDEQIARFADSTSVGKISCEQCYLICKGEDKRVRLNLKDNLGDYSNFTCEGSFDKNGRRSCYCKIFGWEGEDGGKGGNGGRGGMGGLPGSVKLVALNNDSHNISTYGISGKRGMNGEGGVGGKSGKNGHNVIYTDSYSSPPQVEQEQGQITFYRLGPNGSDGYNSVGYIEDRVAPDVLEPLEIKQVLTEHKIWLREVSGLSMSNETLLTFYRNLYDNSILTNMHNVSYLLKEIKDIDEQYIQLKSEVDFLPFYASALGRVYGFAESIENSTSHAQDGNLRGLVYIDLLGRMYNFTQQPDNYIPVKIPTIFLSEHKAMREIKDMVSRNKSVDIVMDRLNNSITNPIDELTNVSRSYLEYKIHKGTNKRVYYLAKNIDSFVSALVKVKKEPKNHKRKIIKWSIELRVFLTTKSYLTSIKLLIDFFTILYEFADIVRSVAVVGANASESLIEEKKNETLPIVSTDLLHRLNRSIVEFKAKEVTRINELLKNILHNTRSNPQVLTDVTEQLLNIRLTLQSSNRLYSINALRADLLNVLKIKLEEISDYISVNKKPKKYSQVAKSQSAYSVLNRIITLATISRGFIDLYNDYSYDRSKLDTIIECIETPNNFLRLTKLHENSIYGLVYPLLQYIEDMIRDTSGNPERLSTFVFDFIKQELRLGLLTIKHNIRQLADSVTVSKGVIQILKDLGGVCTALIAIFDRLQKHLIFRQFKKLEADASALVKMGTIFTDVLLSNGFELITNFLSSNLLLKHYENAFNTFKNFVFPIAQVYLKDMILPKNLNKIDTFENKYSTSITQMAKMLERVEDYRTLVLAGDQLVSRKYFGSRHDHPSEPFFVWKNEQYKDDILKLLSGEKVLFTAEITKSTLSENAIKLNSIDLYLKSKNETMQKSIDHVLARFEIEVKHSGNSQYRYGDQIFLTTSDSYSLSYRFEKDKDGDPLTASLSYWYMFDANVMLSPYASWEILITGPVKDVSYKDLVEFKDDVDLELGGNGYYISKEKVEKHDDALNVKKYYKPVGKF